MADDNGTLFPEGSNDLGPEKYAPRTRRKAILDPVTAKSLEDEIHNLVRRKLEPQDELNKNPPNRALGDVNLLLGRIAGASMDEIDRLIAELQSLRELIRTQGERANREIAGYINLNKAVVGSVKLIGDSIAPWKDPDKKISPDDQEAKK